MQGEFSSNLKSTALQEFLKEYDERQKVSTHLGKTILCFLDIFSDILSRTWKQSP